MMRTVFYVAILVILCWVCVQPARAQGPQYLILRPSSIGQPYGGTFTPVARPTYSYGYFGAQPTRYGHMHGGYYNGYTRWTHYGPW